MVQDRKKDFNRKFFGIRDKEEIRKEQEIEKEENKKNNETNYKDSFIEDNLYPKTKNLKI